MKKIITLIFLVASFLSSFSQKDSKPQEAFYLLDKNFRGTGDQSKATFFMRSIRENDSSWLFDTYNIFGPLISSEHFKDDKAQLLHGESVYFNAKGTRDSICNYNNGVPDKSWYFFNDTGKIFMQKDFDKAVLVATIDRIKQDGIDEAAWIKNRPTTDTVEIESDFPGAQKGWAAYLGKKLKYPERAQDANVSGTVRIQFIVDTEGHIQNPQVIKSVEYSLDKEAMRMITESPAWIPAFQYGKKVKSYKIQPITFRLQ